MSRFRTAPRGPRPGPTRTALLPEVTVESAPRVRVWSAHVTMLVAALGSMLLVASGRPQWLVGSALVAATLLRPSSPAPALFAGGVGLAVLGGPPPSAGRLALLLAGVHLVVHAAALAGTLPPRSSVEARVLLRSAVSFGLVQGVTQVLALLGRSATGFDGGAWLPAAAGAALATGGWVVLLHVRTRRDLATAPVPHPPR